ncbi:MAG: hypothetical protein M3R38_12240 [Actinomycetota bacterium]|nr:hypothetical protein [Actinomycetota bacterium]
MSGKNSWSGPGRGRGSMGSSAGGGPNRHQSILPGGGKGSGQQKMPQQGSKKRPSAGSDGMGRRMGKGSMGSSRGYRSFASPKNDGNLYTSQDQLRKTDLFGNHKGAARPSGMGCALTALGAISPFVLTAALLLPGRRGW